MRHWFMRLFPFIFACALFVGCSNSSSDSVPTNNNDPSGVTISSIADDMRACAPDLADSAITIWEDEDELNGWSGDAEYGVLKKHFDSSSGTESIYGVVLMVDDILTGMVSAMPAEIWTTEGSVTEGGWTVTYELVDGDVTLPDIFGGTTVSDFENYLTMSGNTGSSDYNSYLHYKPAGDDGIEKILYRYEVVDDDESGVIYATRNTTTHAITVWVACHKAPGSIPAAGASHEDLEFRCVLYFEGNTAEQTFKFKLKTDAANGWAFWGGGSTASDEDTIAVRGTDLADSDTYANDGLAVTDDSDTTTYVILTFGDMKDDDFDGNGYPKNGTAANLGAEVDPAVGYIILGDDDCLYDDINAVRTLLYPEEKSELGFAG